MTSDEKISAFREWQNQLGYQSNEVIADLKVYLIMRNKRKGVIITEVSEDDLLNEWCRIREYVLGCTKALEEVEDFESGKKKPIIFDKFLKSI